MRRRTSTIGSLLVLLFAGIAAWTAPAAPDSSGWPQWRGPDRSGVSRETGLRSSWPEGGPPLLWKATGAGSGFSSVAVKDGRLYTMGKHDDSEYLLAYDVRDGSPVWKLRIGGEYDNDKGGGPRSTPTLDGDRLYVLGATGDLSAVTLAGKSLWHVPILSTFKTENIKWGLSESPLVEGDKVIVATGSAKGSIVAFDKKTGKVVWQSAGLTDEPGYASALAVTVGDGRQIVHFTGESAVGVRPSDGKVLWRYTKASNDTANCATPVYQDGHVFVTSGYDTGGALLKLTSKGAETTADEVYFTQDMKNHHGGVVLVDGHLYGFSNSILTCLDWKTGKLKWQDRSVGKGSLIAADGMLYVLSEGGVVGLVRANPERYEEISRFSFELGSRPSWAHPVIADGRLYIRNRDDVMCYDIKKQ